MSKESAERAKKELREIVSPYIESIFPTRKQRVFQQEVMILNVGGYIGESTHRELEYAAKLGKEITYLEPMEVNDG